MSVIWGKIKKIFFLLTLSEVEIREDDLKNLITIAGLIQFPQIFGFITIFFVGLFHINLLGFCFLLYKGQITLSHLGLIAEGIWVIIGYWISVYFRNDGKAILCDIKHFEYIDVTNVALVKKNEKLIKLAKWSGYFILFFYVVLTLTFMPFNGQQENLDFVIFFINHYLSSSFSSFATVVYYSSIFHGCFVIVSHCLIGTYCQLQLTMQLHMLNDSLSELVKRNLGYDVKPFFLLDIDSYQKDIKDYLIKCVKHQVIIKNLQAKMQDMYFIPLLIHAYFGIITLGAHFYLLTAHSDISLIIILRMVTMGILVLLILTIICYFGEKLGQQGDIYSKLLTNCPWYLWNNENKKILLLMMLNSSKTFSLSAINIIILDITYIYNYIRSLYAIIIWLFKIFYGK